MTHCDYVLIFSLCVFLAYDLCPQQFLSVGQLLSDCTSQSNTVWITWVLHLMCNAHTHTKFRINLPMYVQMLDTYRKYPPWHFPTLIVKLHCNLLGIDKKGEIPRLVLFVKKWYLFHHPTEGKRLKRPRTGLLSDEATLFLCLVMSFFFGWFSSSGWPGSWISLL